MSIAIKFENISKQYRLGTVGTGTISHDLNRWWHIIRGKEDPYLQVGQENDRSKKADSDYVWALKNITFEVEQGDVVGIIGKNGAGKSTLLKILSRVTRPTTGDIKAHGRIASLLEVGTGFHPEMTGRENIYLNGAIMGMTKPEITKKLDEIIDFAGIEKYIDTPAKRYSSGMIVRLGFAIAAHLDPEILVVDEVLAVGDAEFQKKAIGKMQDVSKGEGRTVLFVSHNMTAVKNLCKTGVILKNGTLEYQGHIDDVIDRYIGEQRQRSSLSLTDINHAGNGSLRFTNIQFIDSKGQIRNTYEVGEELNIVITFEASERFYTCFTSRIDIGINNILDTRVAWLSSFMLNDKISNKEKICFKIPKLLLTEGIYNINLYSETNEGLADWVQNVAELNIVFHDYYKNGRNIPEKQGYIVIDFDLN